MTRTLGAFEIQGAIASGSMGKVYAARHLIEGYEAALKVVPDKRERTDELLAEVRATATLNHPSIVALFDYGCVTPIEAEASQGEFASGALWFAMERATSGTLETAGRPSNWAQLRRAGLELLDALAHAHARGRIHRDLKPANVLLTRRDGLLSYLLADFGIAHVRDPDAQVPETTDTFSAPAAGTPMYMAPEQIQARWRDQGPWTDLYALGCLMWELSTGGPVFDRESSVAMAMAHVHHDVGPFEPKFDVPPELEGWLRVLLTKSWRGRFASAAEAANVLAAMTDVADQPGDPGKFESVAGADTAALPTLEVMITQRMPSAEMRAFRRDDAPRQRPSNDVPEVPADWRPAHATSPLGARTGLGLFGLREIGLHGRETERDALWQTLVSATSEGAVRVTLLEGAAGFGKSALLRWLGVRTDELGLATVMRAGHGRMLGPSSGLTFALARQLGTVELERDATRVRIDDALASVGRVEERLSVALTEVLQPTPPGGAAAVRFESPGERYRVIADYLAALAGRRTVLLLLDDAQWGADALGFAEHLLAESPGVPIAVVIAIDSDELGQKPLAARRVKALRGLGAVSSMSLDRLAHSDHVAMLREQVGLSPRLGEDLVAMSSGDLNYTLCVLGDWVARGVLRPGDAGYDLDLEDDVEFPRGVVEAWSARLDRFCARFSIPGRVRRTLEIAAVLGDEVSTDEWTAACAAYGEAHIPRTVSRLVDAGLARLSEVGFDFHHGVAEALLHGAYVTGRLRAMHAACAHAIQHGVHDGATAAERRGLHLLDAGEREAALDELRLALDARMETSAYEEAIAISTLYLDTTPTPAHSEALTVRAKRADAYRFVGDEQTAESEAQGILATSRAVGVPRGTAEGLRVLAGLEQHRGRIDEGISRYTEAISAYRQIEDDLGVSKAVHGRGWLYLNRGQFAEARRDFKLGSELAAVCGAEADVAWNRQGLAEATAFSHELDVAERAARDAVQRFVTLGSRSGRGMALTSLANVQRERGDVDAARASYAAATDLLSSFDSPLVGFTALHRVAFEAMHGDRDALGDAVRAAWDGPLPRAFHFVVTLAELGVARGDRRAEVVDRLEKLSSQQPQRPHPLAWRVLETIRDDLDAATARRVDALLPG